MSNDSDPNTQQTQPSREIVESPAAERGTVNPEHASGGQYASWESVTRQRDSDGTLLPKDVFVEEFGDLDIEPPYALAKPFHGDQRKRYLEDVADPETDKDEIPDAELAELFDRNLEQPDLTHHPACDGRISERFVREEMSDPMQDACFIAVLLASDEHEFVRRMRRFQRGELTDAEVKMAMESDEGMQPAGDRSRNQARRDRRQG